MTLRAPAKVNLHLEVIGRRPDGYHELVSLFQAVSLWDYIRISAAGPAGRLSVSGDFPFPAEQNIIARAIRAFRAETGIGEGIEVAVKKRIPFGGGFGGGSSDAAATLRGLAALFDEQLTGERLLGIGASLCSDVPFFLRSAAALVEGRGEKVTPIAPREDFLVVAVTPHLSVSTVEAYRWIDERWDAMPRSGLSPEAVVAAYRETDVADWRFTNSFDAAVFERHPGIGALRSALVSRGAVSARLTGSGSTVIGIFVDADLAADCARAMSGSCRFSAVLRPLAGIPPIC